jgi:hypothetical protein
MTCLCRAKAGAFAYTGNPFTREAITAHSSLTMTCEVPVLLIIFNRPDLTAEVVKALRKVRPRRLFIAADGPRPDFETDAELCRRTREIASNPDWECEVTTLFQKENLGIGRGESTAMSWFFDHVEEGIILEDDCLPSRSFFEFSAYLLDKYRDNQRVASVGGNFFLPQIVQMPQPYYFSKYLQAWGWATWRRTWQHYRFDLSFSPEQEWDRICQENSATQVEAEYWQYVTRALAKGKVDTWDFQLVLICWKEKLLHIAPTKNLVKNIGFRPDATHTVLESPMGRLSAEELDDYRTDVEMQTLPEIDSLTFYVRFLDSLTSPWWLQQALPLDQHLSWARIQYQNLEKAIGGVREIVFQSANADSIEIFQQFESEFNKAEQELAASLDRLSESNQRLAQAVQELNQLKQRVNDLVSSARYEPAFRMILLKSVRELHQGLRGFQGLLNLKTEFEESSSCSSSSSSSRIPIVSQSD